MFSGRSHVIYIGNGQSQFLATANFSQLLESQLQAGRIMIGIEFECTPTVWKPGNISIGHHQRIVIDSSGSVFHN